MSKVVSALDAEDDAHSEALAFLQAEYANADGFISVAAISLEDKITVRTAKADDIALLGPFIAKHNGVSNLYFSVNPIKTCIQKKASKPDVKSLAFLHVDIDPRDGFPLDQERKRIKKRITDFSIAPNVIIDSGGGYQCLWRISPTIPVANDIAALEDFNRRVAHALGGDNCWNIERLLRLPGTMNLPNAKKKAKGRKPAPAKLVKHDEGAYALGSFDSLPQVAVPITAKVIPIKPGQMSGAFLEMLKSDPLLHARWHGDKKGLTDKSRSGLDMSLASMLWKRGCPKEEIAAILLNFDHGKGKEAGAAYVTLTLSKLADQPDSDEVERRTDLGNARRLVRRHGEGLRYCHTRKQFLFWDDNRWRFDEDGHAMRLAKETVHAIHKDALGLNDDSTRMTLARWAMQSENIKRLQASVELAKSEPNIPIAQESLDCDPLVLGVQNGVVNLRTGKLRESRREDYITKSSPVLFDKAAKCPTWLAFLNDIFAKNKHLIAFVQRAMGYSLTGRIDERCIFILHGTGSNGKTTLLNVIGGITGDYGKQCDPETLMIKRTGGIPNDVARLNGARFVATSETDKGQRFAEALIKRLTGKDKITARFLYGELFEFEPQFKIWIAANYKPTVGGNDYAIWQRIKLIPFSVTIPEENRDAHLDDKLKCELPGILNWAIKGCLAWQKNGLQEPEEVKAATQAYKQEMDTFGSWLSDCCEVAPNAKSKASNLYFSYKEWNNTSGEQLLSQKEFGRVLQEQGFTRKKGKDGNYYVGLEVASVGLQF